MISRLQETISVISQIADDLSNVKNEVDCLIILTVAICDISKSLAIIADSLNDSMLSGSEQERWLNGE